jgi:D-alanyl-D-alanine carboxypeptidase
VTLWALLACGGASGFGPPSLGSGEPFTPVVTSSDLRALELAPSVPAPVKAAAAIVVDGRSGHEVASRNADARLAPASLTKMMTALVAHDRAGPAEPIVATARSRSEPSIIGLDPGDTLALEDMLYGLLLPSGNDAALAIAESVGGGSIERFVGWMNEKARALGLRNTHFANPHGLDQAGHYSSGRDMAVIARAFMAEPALAKIVNTPTHTAQSATQVPFFFRSSNPLLGQMPGVEGIKTGFTDNAGRCYAVSLQRDGKWLIAVLLNSPNIGAEGRVLLELGLAVAQPTALRVSGEGFSAVHTEPRAVANPADPLLTGWERSFLRTYGGRSARAFWLGSRMLARSSH